MPRISDIIYLLKNGKVKPKSKKRYDPEIAVNSKHNEAGSKQFTVYHFIYYLIDACLGRVYIAINFWRDRLILCDRTIYDIVARQGYSTISPWMNALILLTPKPDLAFLLYCDPSKIHSENRMDRISNVYTITKENISLKIYRLMNQKILVLH